MKKFVSALLAALMILSLAACGGPTGGEAGNPPESKDPAPANSEALSLIHI